MAKSGRCVLTQEQLNTEADREMRQIGSRLRRHGREAFVIVKSAEGAPASAEHLRRLQAAE